MTAWRHLADNIHKAVKKGDAVIVHGRLRTDSWKREDGQMSSSLQIEASLVGHDLTRGTSVFLRTPKPERTDRQDAEAVQEAEELMRAEQEQAPVDGWGQRPGRREGRTTTRGPRRRSGCRPASPEPARAPGAGRRGASGGLR